MTIDSRSLASPKPVVYCFGASHKTAPLPVRELLYLSTEQLEFLLPLIKARYHFDELVVLSTCNRIELYAISLHGEHQEASVREAYCEMQLLAGRPQLLARDELIKHSYYLQGPEAVEHIFAVAASLDSLVIGETQITGQFKDALAMASQAETLGPYLDRLAQEVLAAAKKVRSRTRIGEKTVSISHAAIDLAKRVFRNIGDHSFLLIGAGEMAKLAALYARNYSPREIYVANRSIERARGLVASLGMGQAFAMDALPELLATADIVISSTSALQPVVTYSLLKQVMRRRRGRPLFLVDIAIPRDIEASCGELSDVYLFEIDDLQKVVDENLEERRQAADEARQITHKAAEHFSVWLASVAVKPILANFREYLQVLIDREMTKTLSRELYQDLSEQQLAGLKNMLQVLAGRMVSDAARAINNPEEAMREQLAAALRLLFTGPGGRNVSREPASKNEDDDDACQNKIIHL